MVWHRLWGALDAYIRPGDATERKDLVNVFVLIGAGVVGTLTALAALLNAYFTRRNLRTAREALRQQRDLDERRAQDDALQAYLEQMGDLLTDHKLKEAQPDDAVALLAGAQTLTVLSRLDARRKGDLLFFVYGAGLIPKDNAVLNLLNANLVGADLSDAILIDTKGWTVEQLGQAKALNGARMPTGRLYEDWLEELPDQESRAWHHGSELYNQTTYADVLKGIESRGEYLYLSDAGKAYLRWLKDREPRGEETAERGHQQDGSCKGYLREAVPYLLFRALARTLKALKGRNGL